MKKIIFLIISVNYICDVSAMKDSSTTVAALASSLKKYTYCGNKRAAFVAAKNIAILMKVNEDERNNVMTLLQKPKICVNTLSIIFRDKGELPRALPEHIVQWQALKDDPNAQYSKMIALLKEAGNYEHAIWLIRDSDIATPKQQLLEFLKDAACYREAFARIIAIDSEKRKNVIGMLQNVNTYSMVKSFMEYYQDFMCDMTTYIAEDIKSKRNNSIDKIHLDNGSKELHELLKRRIEILGNRSLTVRIIETLADDIIDNKWLLKCST